MKRENSRVDRYVSYRGEEGTVLQLESTVVFSYTVGLCSQKGNECILGVNVQLLRTT